jgi:uncharacterized protein
VARTGVTAPTPPGERVDALDAVRGVALLGILLVNALAFSGLTLLPPDLYESLPLAVWHEPSNFAVQALVEAKFYSLFSLLFGVSFAVFVQRAAARGVDALRLFRRRLAGLLLIGFAHTIFIWMGDILVTYAVLGFALVPFMRRDDRTVLRWAAAMLLAPIPIYALLVAGVSLAQVAPPAGGDGTMPPVLVQAVEGFASGTYADVVKGNAVFAVGQLARRFVLMFYPRVFGMFLLGLWIGRSLLGDLRAHERLLKRVLIWGTVIGLPLSVAGVLLEGRSMELPAMGGLAETALKTIGIPALALAYAAGFALLFQRVVWLRRAFAPAGQMALTHYLLQSVAGVVIFYGIGLGWFGAVPLIVVLAGAVGFFALQMLASALWLSRARFGPAEWLWRMFTYRDRVPLLK